MPPRRRSRRRPRRRPETAPSSFWRRRSTKWLIAAVITLAVGVTLGALAGVTGDGDEAEPTTPPPVTPTTGDTATDEAPGFRPPPLASPTPLVALPTADPALVEEAVVLDIVDGDTIDVLVGGEEERVRLFGVDTPERGDRCYDGAADRIEALAGERVLLLPDLRERDPYDRLLRYVFTEDGELIDGLLVAEGLGEAWRRDGQYRDEIVAAEERARAAGVGCLWD